MTLSQETLAAAAHARAADVLRAATGRPCDMAAIVVVRDVHVRSFVEGALAFASELEHPVAGAWYAGFTRTVFLAGDCERLESRHRPRHVSPDGAIGWFGPAPQAEHAALRRLLRAFEGPEPAAGLPVNGAARVPGAGSGRRRRLLIDIGHSSVQDLLIHVHHTVCEAVIRGLIRRGDALALHGVDALEGPVDRWDYARVHRDTGHDERLRMYTWLGPATAQPGAERA